jgi:hypothetical protein
LFYSLQFIYKGTDKATCECLELIEEHHATSTVWLNIGLFFAIMASLIACSAIGFKIDYNYKADIKKIEVNMEEAMEKRTKKLKKLK